MKKRISMIIITVSVITTIITGIFTSAIYYNFYEKDAKSQMKTITEMAARDKSMWDGSKPIHYSAADIMKFLSYDLRISVIKSDGTVEYDNFADYTKLDNHKNRPEISNAFKHGQGEDTRFSKTLNQSTYYYAIKINDDTALRFSREIKNIRVVFGQIMPFMSMVLILISIIASIITSQLTKKIVEPVKNITLTLDDWLNKDEVPRKIDIYEELLPFAEKIKQQKIIINEYIDEIKHERDTINLITQNMQEGFILIDKDKNILSINNSAKSMMKNEKFDLNEHKNIIEFTRNREIIKNIDKALNKNEHTTFDTLTDNIHYRYFMNPVTENEDFTSKGLLILIENVTTEKQGEIMRREFSANVSHELKTPLTTINGFAEMIKEGLITNTESIKKYCAMMYKEGNRLITLIEDIIRLSEIEENSNFVNETMVDINQVCKEVCELLKPKAESKNVIISYNAQVVFIKANESYINELLYNLIDNGIKYNKKEGKVDVSITKTNKDIIIRVKDTGIGISKEHHGRIFERFYRADKSRSKDTGGTGLGLSIVKHIVELYDGTIELKSEEKIGTEITIKFKIKI